jgi:hypothetical protein
MKLTELKKRQNKAALIVKREYHRARRKAFENAISDALAMPGVVEAKRAAEEADDIEERLRVSVQRQIDELTARKAEIDQRILELRNAEYLERARMDRRAAYAARNQLIDKVTREAEARFPDLAESAQFYVTNWNPPSDVLEAMEEARRRVAEG